MLTDPLIVQARTRPHDIAVSHAGVELDYSTLLGRAHAFARLLSSHGIGPKDRVALTMPKGLEALVALVGVSLTGSAFVPCDPGVPPQRLIRVLQDCDPKAIVSTTTLVDRIHQVDKNLLTTFALVVTDAPCLLPNAKQHDFTSVSNGMAGHRPMSDDLPAYLLYTSGSTGEPKGVVHSHRSASSFVNWAIRTFGVEPGSRLTNCAQWSFDLSVFDLWATLSSGARVELVPAECMLRPQEFVQNLHAWQITHLYAVPSTFSLLESDGGLHNHPLPHLTHALYAGEPFGVSRLRSVMKCLPRVRFHNLFGPTETNVCTHHEIPSIPDENTTQIPVGKACDHLTVELLDETGQPAGPEVEGEICVAGPSVLTEYFRRPNETRNAFFDAAHFPDARPRYRTGDRASLDTNGLFWFHGRRDRLVKRRGYRIELGEIETAIGLDSTVLEAAAFSVRSGQDTRVHVAVALNKGASQTPLALKVHCSKFLPRYMMPDSILILDQLPRTPNGKVDLQRLADPSAV